MTLKLNGKAGWDKTLNESKCQHVNSQDICTWKSRDLHLCERTHSYFQCPKCDHIELGQLGSYGLTFRTQFNGYYSDEIYEVEDKPNMTMYDKDINKATLVA